MTEHVLKTWPEYFKRLWSRYKTFEVRLNDRNFKPGDRLILREYDPKSHSYSGRFITAEIGFVLYGGQWGINQSMCVMSLLEMTNNTENERLEAAAERLCLAVARDMMIFDNERYTDEQQKAALDELIAARSEMEKMLNADNAEAGRR